MVYNNNNMCYKFNIYIDLFFSRPCIEHRTYNLYNISYVQGTTYNISVLYERENGWKTDSWPTLRRRPAVPHDEGLRS